MQKYLFGLLPILRGHHFRLQLGKAETDIGSSPGSRLGATLVLLVVEADSVPVERVPVCGICGVSVSVTDCVSCAVCVVSFPVVPVPSADGVVPYLQIFESSLQFA